MAQPTQHDIRAIFEALLEHFGPQHWWPAQTRLEIIVGAVLTQNTNWLNVERAITNLRQADMLDLDRLAHASVDRLAELIRPSGYYNVKARRLKSLLGWIWQQYGGDLDAMFDQPTVDLREQLLGINGIGKETADSILLYAGEHPTFVVDAYTARVAIRHGLIDNDADYDSLKALFEDALEPDTQLYNEYHALLVAAGKHHCRPKARCQGCPLEPFEHDAGSPV